MSNWYNETSIYHIYPIGFCGAPKRNEGGEPVNRIEKIARLVPHLQKLSIGAIYLGPIWESSEHGYDTTDYRVLDRRLGTNSDFKAVADALHAAGIKIILDGVFNHTGRDFFAFKDIQLNKQGSRYCGWYKNLNFGGQSPCGDPFWYEGWHGHYNLVKLDLRNPEVCDYLIDAVGFWIDEFGIDGIRFDAADCLEFDFIKRIRGFCKSKRSDFWLMGEIIHGDYNRWANPEHFDSVTNYEAHKGIWSSHNDKNYFEIDYSINRQSGNGGIYKNVCLYNFADNHDVNRLASTLTEKNNINNVYTLMYAMPGIPSIYYGSEYGIEGRHENNSDDGLRPSLEVIDGDLKVPNANFQLFEHIVKLGRIYSAYTALREGSYQTVIIRNKQMLFKREHNGQVVYAALNCEENDVELQFNTHLPSLVDVISGNAIPVNGGNASVKIPRFSSMIIVADDFINGIKETSVKTQEPEPKILEFFPGQKKTVDGVPYEVVMLAKDYRNREELVVFKNSDNGEVWVLPKQLIIDNL